MRLITWKNEREGKKVGRVDKMRKGLQSGDWESYKRLRKTEKRVAEWRLRKTENSAIEWRDWELQVWVISIIDDD